MVAQIRVWIECPVCGSYEKLKRQVMLPFEARPPMRETTGALCDGCRGLAVMHFERSAIHPH
jgi:hypothetical protein